MRKSKRWIGKLVLLVVLAYLTAAITPYVFLSPAKTVPTASTAVAQMSDAQDRATILETGKQAMDVRLNLIASAQTSLIVGTYLYGDDESGHTIAAALLDAADRGVQVRLVTDGLIGWFNLMGGDLGYALGAHPNVELRFYNPVNVLEPWGLNARYHEKYVVADDRVMVLGGRNISDEFLTAEGDPHYNFDMDVLVWQETPSEHSAVQALVNYFDALWDTHCTPQYQSVPAGKRASVDALRSELQARYAALQVERAEAFTPIDWQAITVPIEGYALLTNPTDPADTRADVWAELIGLMESAQERVWVQTPYLVLNSRMRDDLARVAAQPSEMTVLTNSKAGGNNIVASSDAVIHRGMVTSLPLDYYEMQATSSMHTKALLIDDDVSVFGSFNFDMRSAYIDTEVMLVIRSEAINQQLEAHMQQMQARSLLLTQDGYAKSETVEELPIDLGKQILLYVASPFISLIRFLI